MGFNVFFVNASGDPILEIRAVSYTSETMANTLPHYIDQNYLGNVALRIKVLVRSEYEQFASRPKDFKFNQIIRWRISRAKADWYRWIRNTRLEKSSNTLIELEIRDYRMDPSARMLLLGKSEGFFGLYALNSNLPLNISALRFLLLLIGLLMKQRWRQLRIATHN